MAEVVRVLVPVVDNEDEPVLLGVDDPVLDCVDDLVDEAVDERDDVCVLDGVVTPHRVSLTIKLAAHSRPSQMHPSSGLQSP